jgi:Xaa-Pro aminopeptidase
VAFLLEQTFRELGADGPAFDTIVAAGERAALPHAHPSDRTIVEGDMVVIDFGASAAGYCADITRTVVVGSASPDQRRALETVRTAQQLSVQAMKPGVACAEIDRIAREAVTGAVGAEAAFGHGLGHGVGLEVHERPGLSSSDDTVLQPGMVITNEPGVYIAGWGGVRLEDMVLITAQGNEVISSASRTVEIGS